MTQIPIRGHDGLVFTLPMADSNLHQLLRRQSSIDLVLLPILAAVLGHPNGFVLRRHRFGQCRLSRRWGTQENGMDQMVTIDNVREHFAMSKRGLTNLCRRNRYLDV
jgi:hypothetical protein